LTFVGAVTADFSGFVAALSDQSGTRLICSHEPDGRPQTSADPAALHGALAKAEGKRSPISRIAYASARRAIEAWINDQEVTRLVCGIEGGRRDFAQTAAARVQRTVAAAPAHERGAGVDRSSRVRQRLGRRLSRGLERAIENLDVTLSDDRTFTRELERLLPSATPSAAGSPGRPRVLAVLLMSAAKT
jgi:hypothetical protein